MVVHHRFHRGEIVERHVYDISRFGPKAVGIFGLSAYRDGKQRAAVKRVIERDDFGFVRTVAGNRIMTRQFEGSFVSLCAGIGEKHPIGKGGVN